MHVWLLNLRDRLRSSYWFVPLLMTGGAILLAVVLLWADALIPNEWLSDVTFIYHSNATDERALMLAIAGLMIAVVGVLFSITMVPLTLAASQFGPRLLRNFLRDTTTQLALGFFVGTLAYCLVVMVAIPTSESSAFTPQIAVTVALAAAIFSVVVLIIFLDHLAVSLQASNVITEVSTELCQLIDSGEATIASPDEPVVPVEQVVQLRTQVEARGQPVVARRSGYVRACDHNALVSLAAERGLVFYALRLPGDFVTSASPLLLAWPPERVDESLAATVTESYFLGEYRTLTQDVEFGVNSLVEIAMRALSPAINDPFTAMSCIDWLGVALSKVARHPAERAYLCDDAGQLRLLFEPMTFERLLNAAFNQIRQYGRGNADVLLRMLDTLATIAYHTRNEYQRTALAEQLQLLADETGIGLPAEGDRTRVNRRVTELARILANLQPAP